ncbi:6-cysteine protein [Plasmodium ovale wallikeri]|uniref:6-cysteine protein n=1 Tax=Plasmodium ovale wallikeri TaxID=864142 RepID=A0A1A8YL51_PLAOA|nr:6-cysteine protein [Plasmodium ovale wallikeri]
MRKKNVVFYLLVYGIFVSLFINYDNVRNLLGRKILSIVGDGTEGRENISGGAYRELLMSLSSLLHLYVHSLCVHLFGALQVGKRNGHPHNHCQHHQGKHHQCQHHQGQHRQGQRHRYRYTRHHEPPLIVTTGGAARKLSGDEKNVEMRPFVKSGEKNETVVNLYEYFIGSEKKVNGNNEVFINVEERLHRVVIVCSKPSLHYSHVIARPIDALQSFIDLDKGKRLSEEVYPVLFYQEEGNWGLKNILSTGMIEFIVPPYSRSVTDLVITCANVDINRTYRFEDTVMVRIRMSRSTEKVLGLSTDPKDASYFEKIVSEEEDEYDLGSYSSRVVALKLEDAELDPPNCFKMVYEEDKKVQLEMEFFIAKCINLDRKNFKLRIFYLPENFEDEELQFSCFFTYKKKKKKVTFGDGERTTIKEIEYLDEDKKEFNYFNGVPYKICNFEYKGGDDTIQVCERTINEFSLFIYNCDTVRNKQHLPDEEPVTTIRYLNDTYPISKFADIAFYTKDVDIEGLRKKFPNYRYFMTSYINHGPYPLVIECFLSNGTKAYQKATILLHVRTNLKERSVSFCDFRKGKIYDYLNVYFEGDTCEIKANSSTSFGFRCPEGTVKKPERCFWEVYFLGDMCVLEHMFSTNLVTYSSKHPTLALAAFSDRLSKSYTFECHCVREDDTDIIEKKVIVKYINEDEIYDYNDIIKVKHKSFVMNPQKTHLCDFVTDKSVLQPMERKPKNYMCSVYPKPMEYVALNCPINLVDEENEKEISEMSILLSQENIRQKIKERFKKRNIYSRLYHIPRDAPRHVINKNFQVVTSIDSIIPGVIVNNFVKMKISKIRKTDEGIYDPSLPPDENDDINRELAKYIGHKNSIENGLFIFQLPPYIKRNEIIEFSCINDNTKKNDNIGNNGIMTVHLKPSGEQVKGCYFYRNKPEYSFLKHSIKVGSGTDCILQSDGELEYIGIMCSVENSLFLTPPECFHNIYDSTDNLVNITTLDKDFKIFSNERGISYLKIPQSFLAYTHLFCYCNTEEAKDGSSNIPIKKENKISIELNTSNKDVSKIVQIDHMYESDFFIGHNFVGRKGTPILRKKHVCDFTKKGNTLDPSSDSLIIHACIVELEENLNLVEIKCPRNVISSGGTSSYSVRDGKFSGVVKEEEITKYAKMKYVPENYDEVFYLKKKEKLEDILPGLIIFDRNRHFGEKGNFTFVTPLIVEKDLILKFYCDNSETVIENKKGKKGIIIVKIPKNVTGNKFYGCDFSGNTKKTLYYSNVYDLSKKSETCEIKLKENMIVSLNCPNGNINPNNCFRNVYIKSNMDQETKENIENIFDEVKVINASYLVKNSSTFLIISKLTKRELNAYCTCEDHESKNVGTIYLKSSEKTLTPKKYELSNSVYVDVSPYYLNDTYICDFTENHFSILSRKKINLENILQSYLDILHNFQHDDFTHFSLNLKLRKEIMKKQYIQYVQRKIQQYREKPFNIDNHQNSIVVYKCNIDLSAFDRFKVKCPSSERGGKFTERGGITIGSIGGSPSSSTGGSPSSSTLGGNPPSRITYTSSLGHNESMLVKRLNNVLFGSLIVNKDASFFEKGEMELIISPYSDSSKSLTFSCENVEKDGYRGLIGMASIFIKKNDNKILGCDFIDVSSNESESGIASTYGGTSTSTQHGKNSFEFQINLVEGKSVYCNVEAIENDVVGFSCPYNFLTSPQDCFESVQIEGLDKELETHKLDALFKGARVLKNEIYKYNYTPSYIILPKKINKSLRIFCTCNSVQLIKTGIIQINVIGDDLNNWFKKEITHNIYAFERASYFYDFSTGPLNISSENVLDIETLSLPTDSTKSHLRRGEMHKSKLLDGSLDRENELEEGSEDEENILNPLRTKQVFEITVAASEFSTVKVACPLRNSQHFRQSKISPETFFEYVYVLEKNPNKRGKKRTREENERLVMEAVQGRKNTAAQDKNKKLGTVSKQGEETKEEYDDMGNKIIIAIKSEKPKATVEDTEKLYKEEENEEDKKDILVIRNINQVISYVNYEREISDNLYISTLHFSPLLLNEAQFFISCDNSLTLNESRRGKTGIVKINVRPNFVKIYGCDFVGEYSTHFYFSQTWEKIAKNYICEIKIEDDSLVGVACPAHTKIHPSDCFHNVIKNKEVQKGDTIIEKKNSFFYKKNGKPTLSFIQINQVFADNFLCKCYDNTSGGDYKEVTIKIIYEPYVMGSPKMNLPKAIVHYKHMDLRPRSST